MSTAVQLPRYEITVETEKGTVKHICAAPKQDEAIERVMRPYKEISHRVVNVRPLGVIKRPSTRAAKSIA